MVCLKFTKQVSVTVVELYEREGWVDLVLKKVGDVTLVKTVSVLSVSRVI